MQVTPRKKIFVTHSTGVGKKKKTSNLQNKVQVAMQRKEQALKCNHQIRTMESV
jgi:hypothetical protein